MYEYKTRVRYTDSAFNGEMSLSAVIDCFQNVFHFECDDTGVGTQDLIMKGLGWFIYFWQVDISRYPKCGEEIIVGTFAYEDRGSSEERNFYIKTVRDDIIVRANSVWSLVDLAKLQIMRIPNEVMDRNRKRNEDKLDMEYLGRRIRYSGECNIRKVGEHIVSRLELDSNRHLNNSEYIKIALATIADFNPSSVTRLCIEYRKQAVEGDLLNIFLAREDEMIIDIRSDSGESFAVMKLFVKGGNARTNPVRNVQGQPISQQLAFSRERIAYGRTKALDHHKGKRPDRLGCKFPVSWR